MRTFDSGATRDSDDGKLDYAGFFSPEVMRRRATYMHEHRVQADGELRDSDNWKRGIPRDAYMSSMYRHFIDVWQAFIDHDDRTLEEALCALAFNVDGMLYETLKVKERVSIVDRLLSQGLQPLPTPFTLRHAMHEALDVLDIVEKMCENCMYVNVRTTDFPCCNCSLDRRSNWEARRNLPTMPEGWTP